MITVSFHVPEAIQRGLDTGIYQRVDGLIRHVGGKQEIVAWLRETGELSRVAEAGGTLPSQATELLTKLGASARSLQMLGAANLAVSAAGFALILHKLGRMDRKLDSLLVELRAVRSDVEWIREVFDADLLARVRALARKRASGCFDDPQSLRMLLGDAIDVSESLAGRCNLLLELDAALIRADLLALYSEYLATTVQLQIGLAWQVQDAAAARHIAREWHVRLGMIFDRVKAPIVNGAAGLSGLAALTDVGETERKATGENLKSMKRMLEHVEEQSALLSFCSRTSMGFQELRALEDNPEAQLMLLCAPEALGAVNPAMPGENSARTGIALTAASSQPD